MGECLVVGRKVDKGTKRATFVILKERPKFPMVGASASTQIRQLIGGEGVRRLEDGPVGGTPIHFGDDIVGYVLSAPLPADGSGWNLSRIADLSLAQAAYQLAELARVWLPAMQGEQRVHPSNLNNRKCRDHRAISRGHQLDQRKRNNSRSIRNSACSTGSSANLSRFVDERCTNTTDVKIRGG